MTISGNPLAPPYIHKLPKEILGQIFRLVLAGEPCLPQHGICPQSKLHYSNYPEFLSHVCSSWRQISISLCELWVHVDLTPYQLLHDQLQPRVETYVSRSGQLPLYVHVHGSQYMPPDLTIHSTTTAFLLMAARVRTLDLNISTGHADLWKRALETFVSSCLPGPLTRLVVRETGLDPTLPKFIMPKDKKVHYPIHHAFSLDVSEEQLDDVFLPCTSLQLRGLFFPWTSKAYQGLTELRLSCPGARVEIPESQLVAILKSNVQLRVLDFRISIQRSNLGAPQVEPVVLPELETLIGAIDHEMTLPRFLRLITPGSKALDVTFHSQNNIDIFVDAPFSDHVREFFSRSNIGQLCVSRIEYSVIIHMLMLALNVRTLILENCHWPWGSKYEVQLPVQGNALDVLYLIDSSIYADDLLELIEVFGVQKVVCWRYRQFHGGAEFTCGTLDEALCERELEVCPALEVLDSNPIQSD